MNMKSILHLSVSVILGGLTCSCSSKPKPAPEIPAFTEEVEKEETHDFYYCGYFVFTDDSAYFEDCATGERFKFNDNELLKEIHTKYQDINGNDPGELFGAFRGFVSYTKNNKPQLSVRKFLGFNQSESCNPNAVMSDTYVVYFPDIKKPDRKITINLLPDYRFTWNENNFQTKQVRDTIGYWGRVDEEDIWLDYLLPEDSIKTDGIAAYFDFPNMQLWVDSLRLTREFRK